MTLLFACFIKLSLQPGVPTLSLPKVGCALLQLMAFSNRITYLILMLEVVMNGELLDPIHGQYPILNLFETILKL